jgi:hypothetical protein
MVGNESMSFVDPNKYIDFRELSQVRVGDYVLDPDGKPYMQVLGWNKNNDLICRQYERDLSNEKNIKSHYRDGNKIAISPEQHLNLVFRRYDSGSNRQLSEEEELQIAECLHVAGVQLNEYIFDRESQLYDENYVDYYSNNMEIIKEINENNIDKIQKFDAMYASDRPNSPLLFVFQQSFEEANRKNKGQFRVMPARIISRVVPYDVVKNYLEMGAIIARRKY